MIEAFLNQVNGIIWNSILIYMLTGIGIWFTVRLGFVQVKHFSHMFSVLKNSRKQQAGSISSFQALCTTLAARVGTGNLMGVAVAISLGGPGAVFWMWIIAFVGMATAFAESALAQLYKEPVAGKGFRGGPAYYMKKGLNNAPLAFVFSLCLFFGYGFVFSSVQANTIADAFTGSFGFDPLYTGIVIMIASAVIVLGGLKNIARFAELVVPVMALIYVIVALVILILNIEHLPRVLADIVGSAFGLREAGSGLVGAAIVQGVKRGLYSNEAGMGSAPNTAAAATPNPNHPASQGYVQMLGVFVDTIVICSATAFIILLNPEPAGQLTGIQLTQQAVAVQVGEWGRYFVTIAILFFAFTSIVANYAYAENNLGYVKLDNLLGRIFFNLGFLAMLVYGSMATLPEMIAMADTATGLMTIVNVIALFMLSGAIIHVTKDYNRQLDGGSTPEFVLSPEQAKRFSVVDKVWLKDKA